MKLQRLTEWPISFIPIEMLARVTSRSLFIPLYHAVSDVDLPHTRHLYPNCTIDAFTSSLDYLCRHFEPVTMEKLESFALGTTTTKKPVFHLTFDDGLKECHSIVAPILVRRGIPATFFINSGFVDNKELFYRHKASLVIERVKGSNKLAKEAGKVLNTTKSCSRHVMGQVKQLDWHATSLLDSIGKLVGLDFDTFLNSCRPYLIKQQIQDLLNWGFTIGSHSISHPHFRDIGLAEQKEQAAGCFNYLEREFKIKERYFSFPFSDDSVTSHFINWLHQHQGCRLSFGISGLKNDISSRHLHRVPFEVKPSNPGFITRKAYLKYLLNVVVNRHVISRGA